MLLFYFFIAIFAFLYHGKNQKIYLIHGRKCYDIRPLASGFFEKRLRCEFLDLSAADSVYDPRPFFFISVPSGYFKFSPEDIH